MNFEAESSLGIPVQSIIHGWLSNSSVTEPLYLEYEKKKDQRNVIKIKFKTKYSSIESRISSMVIVNTGLSIITLDHL